MVRCSCSKRVCRAFFRRQKLLIDRLKWRRWEHVVLFDTAVDGMANLFRKISSFGFFHRFFRVFSPSVNEKSFRWIKRQFTVFFLATPRVKLSAARKWHNFSKFILFHSSLVKNVASFLYIRRRLLSTKAISLHDFMFVFLLIDGHIISPSLLFHSHEMSEWTVKFHQWSDKQQRLKTKSR